MYLWKKEKEKLLDIFSYGSGIFIDSTRIIDSGALYGVLTSVSFSIYVRCEYLWYITIFTKSVFLKRDNNFTIKFQTHSYVGMYQYDNNKVILVMY